VYSLLIRPIVLPAALLLSALTLIAEPLPPRPFPHPDRIRYDDRCLTIDGRDVFIYSGAFHYFRCPKPLWRDRFQKIKDAGFNTVETYAAWDWHEREMPSGLNDFSKVDMTDLEDWLKMAEDFGFYIIVRPGPYICAEWDSGGFPQWLMTRKPPGPPHGESWLRSDDPVFLAWEKHWFDAVCPVIARHQITAKAPGQPGVILVQLENEYNFGHFPDDVIVRNLKALAEDALADGINVPFTTCWTRQVRGQTDPVLRGVFDSCNFYPRWAIDGTVKEMEKLRQEQPDAPLMTTELQGGWFANVGGKLSADQDGLTASQINALTLLAIQHGETLMNYYMLFGGTNPDDMAARNITSTYDYAAPIREPGGVGDRYQRLWAIGHMLQEHGAKLARADAVDCETTTTQDDVTVAMRKSPDGGRYLFVRTSQRTEPRQGTAHVREKSGDTPELAFQYDLEPLGSKILYLAPGMTNADQGEWLPKPAPAINRPADLPAAVPVTTARREVDPGPTHWTGLKQGATLGQAGVFDNRFLFYRAGVRANAATNLLVSLASGDSVLATAGGKPVPLVRGFSSTAVFAVPRGAQDVLLLYENKGHVNIGPDSEAPSGIFGAWLASDSMAGGRPVDGWRMHTVSNVTRRPEVQPEFDDKAWKTVKVDQLEATSLAPHRNAVYRAEIELSASDLGGDDWILNIGRIDGNGWVYVNGRKVGETADPGQSCLSVITPELHEGRNVVAVLVRGGSRAGGMGLPSLSREPADSRVKLRSIGNPAGISGKWWAPDLDDRKWDVVKIGDESASHPEGVLTWYRMGFGLDSPKPGVWVPWKLHLEATGNGFVYVNGYAIGRYWEAGPQHDFYLPECWLNFGAGKTNEVSLSLRPLERGAAIQAASVEPYADQAEVR
jgi:hypothetical protein